MRSPKVRIEEFLPTRRSLLTRLKDWDDQEGWREFFETYWKLIYSVALKAGLNETEAEDLVQDTVLVVARKMKNFHYDPAVGSFKNWLLLNVRSRIVDHLRRRRRRIVTACPAPEETARTPLVERQPDPDANRLEAVWEEEWNRRLTEVVLDRVKLQVSARHFQIFDLYVLQAVPLRQIKETLGVSTAQVYVTKHRISALLRKEVQRLEAKML
ncbi:MAG TPA: sigma-70 family RNA polymerase sigma factor [Verrucomicrobiae bacterium]